MNFIENRRHLLLYNGGGKPIGDLPTGGIIQLKVAGVPTDFIIVHRGKPSGAFTYDDSCDGIWILAKDIYATISYQSFANDGYGASNTKNYMENTFFPLLDSAVQNAVKQVKIPYPAYNNRYSRNEIRTLSTKVFALSMKEVGCTIGYGVDGNKLDYFLQDGSGSQTTAAMKKRIAYFNGVATEWSTRSHRCEGAITTLFTVEENGAHQSYGSYSDSPKGIRPAMILPYDFKVKI